MFGGQRRQFSELDLPTDHFGHRLRKLDHGRRNSRGRCRAHLPRELIAAARHRPDEIAIGTKNLSQHEDLGREVVFLDDPVRPHAAHELVLGEDRAASVDESHERIECPTTQLHRSTIDQQLSAMTDDSEPAKLNCDGNFRCSRHGCPDCSAVLQNFSSRLRTGTDALPYPRFMTDLAALSGVQRHIRGFLQAIATGGSKPMEQMTPREGRAVLEGLQSSVKVDLPQADVAERTISVERQTVKVVVVRPAGVTGRLPVFMFFHGGGWVLGDFPTHERLVRDLVAGSGATAVFVEYDRSPEAHYPVAINQAYAATSWVAAHGSEIAVDGGRLAVAGNGAGGNMAAVVALMAKDRGRPSIRCQVLMWPVTNAAFDTASYDQFAEGHFLTRSLMKWFWDSYTTDPRQRQDVYASPLQASNERLKGLAPALIQTAEMDVLRDEGEAYARKLDQAGIDVTSTRYNGLIHDHGLLNAISKVSGVRSAMLQASAELKRHLR